MKFHQSWRSARAQMDGGTEETSLAGAPQLCKGTQMNCCPQQEFMLQDNINNTLKPVKSFKFLTLTEEMALFH